MQISPNTSEILCTTLWIPAHPTHNEIETNASWSSIKGGNYYLVSKLFNTPPSTRQDHCCLRTRWLPLTPKTHSPQFRPHSDCPKWVLLLLLLLKLYLNALTTLLQKPKLKRTSVGSSPGCLTFDLSSEQKNKSNEPLLVHGPPTI